MESIILAQPAWKFPDELSAVKHKIERKLSALDEKVSAHRGYARSLDSRTQIRAMRKAL